MFSVLQETKLGVSKTFGAMGFKEPIYNRKGHGQLIMVKDEIEHRELDVSRWNTDNFRSNQ